MMSIEINYTDNIIAFLNKQSERYSKAVSQASKEADDKNLTQTDARMYYIQQRVDHLIGEKDIFEWYSTVTDQQARLIQNEKVIQDEQD